jgi:hypothetical protein
MLADRIRHGELSLESSNYGRGGGIVKLGSADTVGDQGNPVNESAG